MRYISTYIRFWLKPCTEWCVAGPTGFEPAILSLTGTRVNQATLRAQTLLFYYNQQTRVCTTANKGFWVYDQRGLLCKPE